MTKSTTRRKRGAPPPRQRDNTTLLIAGGVVAVVLVALLVYVSVSSGAGSPAPVANAQGRTWGQETAKVTIDEWSDFQ